MRIHGIICTGFVVLTAISCGRETVADQKFRAVQGVLDLRTWNPRRDGLVRLDGEWEFYWNQFPKPGEAPAGRAPAGKPSYLKIPGHWNDFSVNRKAAGAIGRGAYRLRILLPKKTSYSSLSVRLNNPPSAYELYINGQLATSMGKVGVNPAGSRIGVGARKTLLRGGTDTALFDLRMSNYKNTYRGGFRRTILLGETSRINKFNEELLIHDMLFLGLLIAMGFFHLGLYLNRREEFVPLIFSVLCLLFGARILITGEAWINIFFPDIGSAWFLKISLLSYYFLVFLFALYIFLQFGERNKIKALSMLGAFSLFYSLVTFLLPLTISMALYPYYHFITAFVMFWSIGWLLRAVRKRAEGAGMTLAILFVFFGTAMNDILISMDLYQGILLAHAGLAIFFLYESYLLVRIFSRARTDSENLSRDLEKKNAELLQLDRMKDEILANTSHEFKTPLNGIIGLSELNLSLPEMPAEARDNSKLIIDSARRLTGQIQDLLDFARLKNSDFKLKKEAADMGVLTQEALRILEPLYRNSGVAIRREFPENLPPAYGDRDRLLQVLFNLLENALKFTRQGSVTIRIALLGPDSKADAIEDTKTDSKRNLSGGSMEISIADTGIGIAPEKQALIFRAFQQADGSISRIYGGTGLGLSIVARLLFLHESRIRLQSVPGEGSAFSFRLPLFSSGAKRTTDLKKNVSVQTIEKLMVKSGVYGPVRDEILMNESAKSYANEPRSDARKSRILAADDDPVNLRIVERCLQISGFEVETAQDGAEALEKLRARKPDLAVLDIMMPGLDGYELTLEIRKKFNRLELPVVLLTARDQPEDIVRGLEIGANDYIGKPFGRNEFLARIQMHLDVFHLHDNRSAGSDY